MAEYVNMAVVSFVLATLFLGGYQVPFASTALLQANPRIALAILGGLLAVGGGLFGASVYQRADSQKFLETGMRRLEPFLLSGLGFAVCLLGLMGALYSFAGPIPQILGDVLAPLLQAAVLLAKVFFFCWLFVWVRWTLPRFRYDQLMRMGWKLMLPLALLNVAVTGVLVLIDREGVL